MARAPPSLLRREAGAGAGSSLPVARGGRGVAPRTAALRASGPRLPPLPLRLSVTGLAEYARCPRRHWFAVQMQLPEPRVDAHGGDDPVRATVRGTLAHALLAEVDLAAPPLERRALLAAAATRRGEDPGRPGVRRIVDDVDRFLSAPAGERLAAASRAGALRRELPFLLRLDGTPPCYLDGAIDALVVDDDGVEILDFKYARHHPGAEERYRVQLAAYSLAATRAFPGGGARRAPLPSPAPGGGRDAVVRRPGAARR